MASSLEPYGIKIAFTRVGVTIALIFIGLPFVVRTLQPVIEDLDVEIEEAATSLGATRFKVLTRVILPYLYPAWLTGFALSFARAVGEYGSVVFISGNMPMRTEISPLLIITKLEQFDYAGATAIAVVMLHHLVHDAARHQRAAGLDDEAGGRLMGAVVGRVRRSLAAQADPPVRRRGATQAHRAARRPMAAHWPRARIPGALPAAAADGGLR